MLRQSLTYLGQLGSEEGGSSTRCYLVATLCSTSSSKLDVHFQPVSGEHGPDWKKEYVETRVFHGTHSIEGVLRHRFKTNTWSGTTSHDVRFGARGWPSKYLLTLYTDIKRYMPTQTTNTKMAQAKMMYTETAHAEKNVH